MMKLQTLQLGGLGALLLAAVLLSVAGASPAPPKPPSQTQRVVEEAEDADGNPVEVIEEMSPGGGGGGPSITMNGGGPGFFEGPSLFQDASPLAALEEMRSLANAGGGDPRDPRNRAFLQEQEEGPPAPRNRGTSPAPWMSQIAQLQEELSRQAQEMRAMRVGMARQGEELVSAEHEIQKLRKREEKALKKEEKKEEKAFKREVKKELKKEQKKKSKTNETAASASGDLSAEDGAFETPRWVKITVNLVEKAWALYESEPPGFRFGVLGVLVLLCLCRSTGPSQKKQQPSARKYP